MWDTNCNYYRLKDCILIKADNLLITGRNTQNAMKNIFKKTYIILNIPFFKKICCRNHGYNTLCFEG